MKSPGMFRNYREVFSYFAVRCVLSFFVCVFCYVVYLIGKAIFF